ncbi:MAG: hypothetical protein KF760_26160 [Candidatus Eremiobacteraeota bacterium]|nr:hypothetical protein [Candidatus Eremiobacteraeota bacterium]MCW5869567.1 hypothetical protein [Candidatus Eremiobacteraeota bacterium]
MAFPVNSGGQIHPQYAQQPVRPQTPVQPQTPNPTDGFVSSQGVAPPQQPPGHVFPNGLKIEGFTQGGQQTALYATMPGGPGGLLGGSILVSISTLPAQNTLGASFQQAQAYELGADGKALRDENNQPKTLPTTVMPDGRVYVQTDKDNPSAPLVMLDPDGSYGLATPARPKVPGDAQMNMGYTREQAEFVKPDGSRGWRVNEDVGAFGQNTGGGLSSMLTMGMGGSGGGREVTYTEVQQTQKGLESRDVHFSQQPGAPWPGFSQGNQWSKLLTMNPPDTRERTVVQEGPGMRLEGGWSGKRALSLLTGKSGWGTNTWTYGKQETVHFVPLSTQKMMQPQGAPPPLQNTPPVLDNTPPPLPNGF